MKGRWWFVAAWVLFAQGMAAMAADPADEQSLALEDKRRYVQELLVSPQVERLRREGGGEARRKLATAEQQFAEGRQLAAQGNPKQAMRHFDRAIRLVGELSRTHLPAEKVLADRRARFEEQEKDLNGLLDAYDLSLKRGAGRPDTLDRARITAMRDKARKRAAAGQWQQGSDLLDEAQRLVIQHTARLLHATTLVYEHPQDSPEQVRAQAIARYESYREMVPLVIKQLHPAQEARERIRSLMQRAEALHAQALALPPAEVARLVSLLDEASQLAEQALVTAGANLIPEPAGEGR
jgi:tetratricopeptide (TPR) repeat protein